MNPGTARLLAAIAILSLGHAAAGVNPPLRLTSPPAEGHAPDAAQIHAAVTGLDDDRVSVRIAAMQWLAGADLGPDEIIAQLRRSDLSPEQRERLMDLGPDSLGRRPRAALGVQFAGLGLDDDVSDDRGVLLGGAVEGFDSHGKLQAGDILTVIGGERVLDQVTARAAIISADPGDTLEVELIRGDRTLKIPVTLGDFARLNGNARRLDGDFAAAWAVRVRRELDHAAAPTIDAGLDADAWAAVDASVAPGFRRPNYSGQVRRYGTTFITPMEFFVPDAEGIVGAGEPRGGTPVAEARVDLSRVEGLRARGRAAGNIWPDNRGQLQIPLDRRGLLERNIEQLTQMLDQVGMPEAQRRAFEERIALLKGELERLDEQMP